MNERAPVTHDLHARRAVRALVASQIREVANAGMGDPDILPFWFGEPDEVTPAYIRDAAIASIAAGETFYTQNFGIPELREAIAGYVTRLHRPVAAGSVAVTSSGMSAGGATIQPRRHPVISHALEKLLVLTTRSAASPRSRKDGARSPA